MYAKALNLIHGSIEKDAKTCRRLHNRTELHDSWHVWKTTTRLYHRDAADGRSWGLGWHAAACRGSANEAGSNVIVGKIYDTLGL